MIKGGSSYPYPPLVYDRGPEEGSTVARAGMASSSNQHPDGIRLEEGVEEMLQKIGLTDKEKATLVVDDEEGMADDLRCSIIGKVFYRRVLHISTITDALRPAWGNPRALKF